MRKILSIFLLISFLIFNQCAINGCQTETGSGNDASCTTCTTEANISTDQLSCIANCKETGDNSELCKTCKDGYTLSTDKTACTKDSGSGNKSGNGDENGEDDSGFGLRFSLVILTLFFLF